jgi:hypothetical protein
MAADLELMVLVLEEILECFQVAPGLGAVSGFEGLRLSLAYIWPLQRSDLTRTLGLWDWRSCCRCSTMTREPPTLQDLSLKKIKHTKIY